MTGNKPLSVKKQEEIKINKGDVIMENGHEAIIKGVVTESTWVYHSFWKKVVEYSKTVDDRVIWSGMLDKPILEAGDKIYIEELDKTVNITEVIRTTKNRVLYMTDYEVERITKSDKTEESRIRAVDEWFEEKYPHLKKFSDLNKEKSTSSRKNTSKIEALKILLGFDGEK